MKTFQGEDEAVNYMLTTNKARRKAGDRNILVMVDGPGDDEFTVMELGEAIDNGFLYIWKV